MMVGDKKIIMRQKARTGCSIGQADFRDGSGFHNANLEEVDGNQRTRTTENLLQLRCSPSTPPVTRLRSSDSLWRSAFLGLSQCFVIGVVSPSRPDDGSNLALIDGILQNRKPHVDN